MPLTAPSSAQALWQKFARLRFEQGDLAELILALEKFFQPGTLAADLARALNQERLSPEADPEPAALRLENIAELPKTEHIDRLALRRRPGGELLLAEGRNRPHTRLDRWTFRL